MAAIEKHHSEPEDPDDVPGVRILNAEEGRAYFDRRAWELMGMSGKEFLRRWDAGEFQIGSDVPEDRKFNRLIMLMPFAGRSYS